jgi:hypothetical protein
MRVKLMDAMCLKSHSSYPSRRSSPNRFPGLRPDINHSHRPIEKICDVQRLSVGRDLGPCRVFTDSDRRSGVPTIVPVTTLIIATWVPWLLVFSSWE